MTFKEIAMSMFPYWLMGAGVLACIIKAGYKDVIRVEKKPLVSWAKFLLILTAYRIFIFTTFRNDRFVQESMNNVSIIPWQATLFVFWEDAMHTIPLYLLRKLIGTKKWTWPIHGLLTAAVMLEFGLGHLYQGVFSAALLSLYIPYTMMLGKKYGFGTVMIGHTLFDLTTILTIKLLSGV